MKFCQLIEYIVKYFLSNNHVENEVRKQVSDLFLLFRKSFIQGKSKWSAH